MPGMASVSLSGQVALVVGAGRGIGRAIASAYARAGAVLVLPDMMRQRRLLTKADRLARRIDRLAAEHPGTPVHLCGYSSGCYLVTEAVKRIKRPEAVGTVILLAGSMSPGYELDAVADRCAAGVADSAGRQCVSLVTHRDLQSAETDNAVCRRNVSLPDDLDNYSPPLESHVGFDARA